MADHIVLFTVEEANALLPILREALDEIGDIREDLLKQEDKLAVLNLIHGDAVQHGANRDHAEWREARDAVEELVRDLNEIVGEIHETGAVLKDLQQGLVDFYHERNGEIVFLCWKKEEERIAYWHPTNTGFSGRQPLSDAEIPDVD